MPSTKSLPREVRINHLSRLLTERYERKQTKAQAHKRKKPLVRKDRKRAKVRQMIAYDFETTPIKAGTPTPLYITAHNADLGFTLSLEIKSMKHLLEIIESRFLDPEFSHFRFIGWNANNFDVYFVAAALLQSDDYILRPYLTKNKKVRGLKVISKENEKVYWEFLDGMSMTGITKPLKDFLKVFAPDYQKLDPIDWEKETFNPQDSQHVEYALRDSVGLWHGLIAAEAITKEHFNIGLQPTIGNLGIKVFQSHMPEKVQVWALPGEVTAIVRDYVMRGGFCFCARKYHGPVWKYDINQAYAAAMRESWLPAGSCIHTKTYNKYAKCAIYKIDATNPKNKVPFYWRDSEQKAQFSLDKLRDCWITSTEFQQLEKEKWKIHVQEGYFWDDYFRMTEYVSKLENLRVNGPGGPKSAQGEMVKAIGNNSYGKTVEQLEGLELLLSKECPPDYSQYQDDDDLFKHIWFKFTDPAQREYHQPHVGAFITAQVRMVLRRAILLNPDAWLYADTDGIMFTEPVPLEISNTEYGKWKKEAEGEVYRLITKKVYANEDASEKHAKGVNIKRLTSDDFEKWFNGASPVQVQTQRNNFLHVMTGGEMFFERTKVGQKFT